MKRHRAERVGDGLVDEVARINWSMAHRWR
jgi:hypothetical protein